MREEESEMCLKKKREGGVEIDLVLERERVRG